MFLSSIDIESITEMIYATLRAEIDVDSLSPPITVKIAVVGNRQFKNLPLIGKILDGLSEFFTLVIISGEAVGVDTAGRQWADLRHAQYIGYPPKTHTRDDYFARNKQIADECHFLLAFINKRKYRSGTWNTINWLTKKPRFNEFVIFNEDGEVWSVDEYPPWLKKRM